jgi:hypothetical protein
MSIPASASLSRLLKHRRWSHVWHSCWLQEFKEASYPSLLWGMLSVFMSDFFYGKVILQEFVVRFYFISRRIEHILVQVPLIAIWPVSSVLSPPYSICVIILVFSIRSFTLFIYLLPTQAPLFTLWYDWIIHISKNTVLFFHPKCKWRIWEKVFEYSVILENCYKRCRQIVVGEFEIHVNKYLEFW